jgi:hypothetical protein
MRSALKLIAFSLLLTGCSQQLAAVESTAENSVSDDTVGIAEETVNIESLRAEFGELIDCSESFEIVEGEFQTVVCNQGVIRFWEDGLADSSLAPWTIWCQPALAAGVEPEFEVLRGESFIIENHNPETIGTSGQTNLCLNVANLELAAIESEDSTTFGLLTNLAQSGVCFEPPSISQTTPLRHICKGFGLGGEEFTLWLESGDVGVLVDEYSSECGFGIAGTYSDSWLITTYDLDAVVSGERLGDLLGLISPVPFSSLCEAEEAG